MRKTARMRELEKEHGRPIEDIVRAALERGGTRQETAEALGISRQTLELWIAKMRIQIRRLVLVG